MTEKHLSSQFDSELNSISSRVMELGGLVESQIQQAIYALSQFSTEAVARVEEQEKRVNQLEVDIDYELSTIIARRQPTARDLRLLIAFSKATANLERMGDEAHKMARMVGSIIAIALMNGLYLPVYFRLGFMKARVASFILFFALFFGITLGVNALPEVIKKAQGNAALRAIVSALQSASDLQVSLLVLGLAFVFLLASFCLSVKFYRNREF